MNTADLTTPKNRTCVFIYESMDRHGGIQSIVYRELDRAYEKGKPAFVVSKPLDRKERRYKNCRIDFDTTPATLADEIMRRISGADWIIDIIALSPEAIPIAQLLQCALSTHSLVHDARACVTILHPRDFMRETEKSHVHFMNKLLAHAIGLRNLVFMNEQCRATHSAFLSRDLSSNKIVPVPIDAREPRWSQSSESGPLRIVCVGRIVNFKAYNFALPSILAKFAEEGRNVTCDIFGYGSEEAKLTDRVKQFDVAHQLRCHRPIPLELFDEVVSRYDLFIGMGTAAIQAAQLGVPTILGIVDDEHGAHGFIHDAPFGNLGEEDTVIERQDLKKIIDEYINASPEEREIISVSGVKYANRYVTENYVEQLTQSSVATRGTARFLAILYCHFYIWMAKDNWLRKSVRLLKLLNKSATTR